MNMNYTYVSELLARKEAYGLTSLQSRKIPLPLSTSRLGASNNKDQVQQAWPCLAGCNLLNRNCCCTYNGDPSGLTAALQHNVTYFFPSWIVSPLVQQTRSLPAVQFHQTSSKNCSWDSQKNVNSGQYSVKG